MTEDQVNVLIDAIGKAKAALRGYLSRDKNSATPEDTIKALFAALETEPVNRVLKELGNDSSETALEPDIGLMPRGLTEGS